MPKTTLSVPTSVRDTFAAVAASRQTTMIALLEDVARRLDREEAMRQATIDYHRLVEEDPESFAGYIAEAKEWDVTLTDGLGDAQNEFPEFNS